MQEVGLCLCSHLDPWWEGFPANVRKLQENATVFLNPFAQTSSHAFQEQERYAGLYKYSISYWKGTLDNC